MFVLEIVAPTETVQRVEEVLSECCAASVGDELLGCQEYPEEQVWFLMVGVKRERHLVTYIPQLCQAQQEHLIQSFDSTRCSVLRFSSPHIREDMRSFPLRCGNSWIPSRTHAQDIYLCIDEDCLHPCQLEWLREHEEVAWSYL